MLPYLENGPFPVAGRGGEGGVDSVVEPFSSNLGVEIPATFGTEIVIGQFRLSCGNCGTPRRSGGGGTAIAEVCAARPLHCALNLLVGDGRKKRRSAKRRRMEAGYAQKPH